MPNRWIKEAYCASSRINAVSAEARDLWVRLLVNADDHGYFHGDAQLVASACFPLQPNARKCEQLLSALAGAGLVVRYESGGKQYLALTQWYERPRSKPKFPAPERGCEQLRASENSCEQLHVSTTTTTTTTTSTAPSAIAFDAEVGWSGIEETDLEMWRSAYPAVDLPSTLSAAAAWARANPKNGKANWRRFLTNWLSRAQQRAPARGGGTAKYTPSRRVAL